MSRKTNQLRRRLRIMEERASTLLRLELNLTAREARLKNDTAAHQRQAEQLRRTTAVCITVEREYDRRDQYHIGVSFWPAMIAAEARYGSRYDAAINVDQVVERVGREIHDKARQAIREKVTELLTGGRL